MKKYFILLVLSFICELAFSQNKVHLSHHGCGFFAEDSNTDIYTWNPTNEALEYVRKICAAAGISPNFIIQRANIDNAMATTDENNNRIIYYNEGFFGSLNNETYKIAVLAHEIAHHLNNNILTKDSRKAFDELEADRFAGSILAKLHLRLDDAIELLNTKCPRYGEGYYPPRSARIEAFTIGFNQGTIKPKPKKDYKIKYIDNGIDFFITECIGNRSSQTVTVYFTFANPRKVHQRITLTCNGSYLPVPIAFAEDGDQFPGRSLMLAGEKGAYVEKELPTGLKINGSITYSNVLPQTEFLAMAQINVITQDYDGGDHRKQGVIEISKLLIEWADIQPVRKHR